MEHEKTTFRLRPATHADMHVMEALIRRSGVTLSAGFYTEEQAAAVTREVFGVDTQLVADGSYFVIEDGARIVACGGWGKRSTPYGGDHAKTEPERLLDPATEAARIRAFFVEPSMARRGLGTLLMSHCAAEAAAAGFSVLELTATLPGVPLYRALGFAEGARFALELSGHVRVPLVRMRRPL